MPANLFVGVVTGAIKVGRWSAALSAIFGIAYILPQIAVVMGMIPSPWDQISLFIPSFFLASAFLVLMVSICHYAPQKRKIWGYMGAAFSIAYMVLVSAVYFVELTVVIPRLIQGRGDEAALLLFNPGSFMQAVDGLGYGFMSLSALFAAQVFDGSHSQYLRFYCIKYSADMVSVRLFNWRHKDPDVADAAGAGIVLNGLHDHSNIAGFYRHH